MKNKVLVVLVLVIVSLACGCAKEVSEEDALIAAQSFVDENVRFYTSGEEAAQVTNKASIQIIGINKIRDEWIVKMHVSSSATGEVKKSGIIVVVDAQTGEVKKEKLDSFDIAG